MQSRENSESIFQQFYLANQNKLVLQVEKLFMLNNTFPSLSFQQMNENTTATQPFPDLENFYYNKFTSLVFRIVLRYTSNGYHCFPVNLAYLLSFSGWLGSTAYCSEGTKPRCNQRTYSSRCNMECSKSGRFTSYTILFQKLNLLV